MDEKQIMDLWDSLSDGKDLHPEGCTCARDSKVDTKQLVSDMLSFLKKMVELKEMDDSIKDRLRTIQEEVAEVTLKAKGQTGKQVGDQPLSSVWHDAHR